MGCFSNVQAPIRSAVSRDVADKDILEKYGVSQEAPKPEAKKGSGIAAYAIASLIGLCFRGHLVR